MNLPKIHPREYVYDKALIRIRKLLRELQKELTQGEYLKLITQELAYEWMFTAQHTIRHERHPDDPDKPGGCE